MQNKKGCVEGVISAETAGTLSGLFLARCQHSATNIAYRSFDEKKQQWVDTSWAEMAQRVVLWQSALEQEKLQPGQRVAIMMSNCLEWVLFEQAALGLGLVVIPLYVDDRADNVAYILEDGDVQVLLLGNEAQLTELVGVTAKIQRVLLLSGSTSDAGHADTNCILIEHWLNNAVDGHKAKNLSAPESLATIVYTSGTTGRPKGVMLSHHNILWNAQRSLEMVSCYPSDVFLSFLPLSHTFERSAGYYMPMMAGSTVAYARSIPLLADDLLNIQPTVLISVPRIFERVALKIRGKVNESGALAKTLFELTLKVGWRRFLVSQGRASWHPTLLLWPLLQKKVAGKVMARLGGQLRFAVCGGAPLSEPVAKLFIAFGLPLVQGYGMTESSPVISVNRIEDNEPASVGIALADVELKIGDQDELLVRSPGIMMGYWNNPEATAKAIDAEGWLHTGDKAKITGKHLYITGRIKDIIVLANGEKVPPADMEAAISADPIFEQVMVLGEGKPYLVALLVPNKEVLQGYLNSQGIVAEDINDTQVHEALLHLISQALYQFPGYAQLHKVAVLAQPWTVDSGHLTPTLKLKRNQVLKDHQSIINGLYHGH
ncbi:MAG: long-chain fatty acid--CoA ligase [Gammaproteobacteria bacterium]|nr:long-chain fatty acid--CoA ligase [Gammaproteobacteria bacterium]